MDPQRSSKRFRPLRTSLTFAYANNPEPDPVTKKPLGQIQPNAYQQNCNTALFNQHGGYCKGPTNYSDYYEFDQKQVSQMPADLQHHHQQQQQNQRNPHQLWDNIQPFYVVGCSYFDKLSEWIRCLVEPGVNNNNIDIAPGDLLKEQDHDHCHQIDKPYSGFKCDSLKCNSCRLTSRSRSRHPSALNPFTVPGSVPPKIEADNCASDNYDDARIANDDSTFYEDCEIWDEVARRQLVQEKGRKHLVRGLLGSFLYYFHLYCYNYPAFKLEIGKAFQEKKNVHVPAPNYEIVREPYIYCVPTWQWQPVPLEKIPRILSLDDNNVEMELTAPVSEVAAKRQQNHKQWVQKIALISRLIIFLIQLMCNVTPDFLHHNNDGFKFTPELTYGKFLDPLVNRTFGGYVNWDAHYFLHITVYGYTSENQMAFFPLLPGVLFLPSRIVFWFLRPFVSLSSVVIVLGVAFNTIMFRRTAENIFKLATMWSGWREEFVSTACVLFCFNPASIFFSGLYTETLFAYLTSEMLVQLYERKYKSALLYSALSTVCRSNGILNVGFIIALLMQNKLKIYQTSGTTAFVKSCALAAGMQGLLSLVPFLLFQWFGILEFCDDKILYHNADSIPWYCDNQGGYPSSLPYFYIQKKYWNNVGFLGYFKLKQIPNFVLAAPVLCALGKLSLEALLLWKKERCRSKERTIGALFYLAHPLHGIFLTLFCFFFMHVQVSTRMIMSSCPYLYLLMTDALLTDLELFRERRKQFPIQTLGIVVWCTIYYFVGAIAFPLGLPWT